MPSSIDEKRSIDISSPVDSHFDDSSSESDIKESLLDDVEAQISRTIPVKVAATTGAEYDVATRTKLMYLAGYFMLNLSLTIYNKAVLGSVCCAPCL